MKNYRYALLIVFSVCAISVLAKTPTLLNKVNKVEMNHWVDSVMRTLTPDERIGQMIVAAVVPDGSTTSKNQIKKLVNTYKVGGLLFSEGKTEYQADFTNYAQSLAKVPLMVTLDGEWGLAMRLKDIPRFPTNMMLGAIQDDRLIYNYGREVARQCRTMGIHVNFAPDMDVNCNPKNPVIGYRSFGEDPLAVQHKGITYSKGLEDGGVMAVAKHFPGHGDTSEDSHKTLPMVNKSKTQLSINELVPFKGYIDAGLSGIMVAHLNVPSIDKSGTPMSLSSKCVKDLLKRELGFEGLVFTDGLGMKGARIGNEQNALSALKAGNDILLYPYNIGAQIAAIKAAVASGKIKQSEIDEHVRRILCYKYVLGINNVRTIATENIKNRVWNKQSELLNRKLYASGITVIRNKNEVLPIKNVTPGNVAVVSIGVTGNALTQFCKTSQLYGDIKTYVIPIGATKTQRDAILAKIKQVSTVIVGVHDDKAETQIVLKELSAHHNHIVPVFFTTAYKMAKFRTTIASAHTLVLAYENYPLAQEYAAQVVFGGSAASGRLPVNLAGIAKIGAGVNTKVTRLGYTIPEEVDIDSHMLEQIDSLALLGVESRAYPGCQVLVARHGKVICNRSYGSLDFSNKEKVTGNILYDLASVSKATGTLSGVMRVYDEGKIVLENPVSSYIHQLKNTSKSDITLKQLLFHESGMPPSLDMFNILMDTLTYTKPLISNKLSGDNTIKIQKGAYGNKNAKLRASLVSNAKHNEFQLPVAKGLYANKAMMDTVMRRIYNIPLRSNTKYTYSCLNFCLLRQVVENTSGHLLCDLVDKDIFTPLGANHTLYRPLTRFETSDIAPTETDTYLRRQVLRGYVHDETAAFSGGNQGNAGLFSNANDLAKLMQMWLNGGIYGGHRYLKESTVKRFITEKSPTCRRGLGFDKPDTNNVDNSPTCEEASAETVGHLGFTGTIFWVDPKTDVIFIFLCNRVCPTRDNSAFSKLNVRPKLFSYVYQNMIK